MAGGLSTFFMWAFARRDSERGTRGRGGREASALPPPLDFSGLVDRSWEGGRVGSPDGGGRKEGVSGGVARTRAHKRRERRKKRKPIL